MQPAYWLDLFTFETWTEFLAAGGTVSGFREKRWKTVQTMRPGDICLCYLTGVSRWIGLLEVTGLPFKDTAPIWSRAEFSARIPVRVLARLDPLHGVPVTEMQQLSVFENLKSPHAWTIRFRSHPSKWSSADGEAVVKAVREAEANPKERPFDLTKLEKVPPILGSPTGTLAGQRAQFTWALNQYDLAEGAENKAVYARRMARYIANAPAKGFTTEQISQGKPYPEAEVARYLEEARTDVSLDQEPPATFNTANGTWDRRGGVEERIRNKVESSIPLETTRRAALSFLALAIETADEDRGDAWYVRETGHGLRLMTGRLLAFEIRRSKVRVSVIGPVSDEVRSALGAETDEDGEFKQVPGGLLLTFPVEHVAEAHSLLKDGLDSFVDAATARVRRAVSLEDHAPEAVEYIAAIVGRDLPQPEPLPPSKASEELEDGLDEDDLSHSKEPRVRGRAPIFESGQRSITSLISDVERDLIGLPDLQRPFVWEDTKVRDLLDSLFVSFPVGTLVFWHTTNDKDARALGAERPELAATTLVMMGSNV